MFVISFSLHFNELNDQPSLRDFGLSFASHLLPRGGGGIALYTLFYIRACKSKTYLILKNIFNRVQI